MVATLSEIKADPTRLVEIACGGEDVLITVDGKPVVKMTRTTPETNNTNAPQKLAFPPERLKELEELREKFRTGKPGPTVDQILDEMRGEPN